jgi:CheY-like chemotaxis protein
VWRSRGDIAREGRPLRLYLAEDAETVRAQIRAWARDSRDAFRLVEFPTARPLLRRAEYDPPDLALVDLTLPGLDGLTALRALRAHRVPVALLAPETSDSARGALEGLIEGAADCFWKRRRDGVERLAIGREHFLERARRLVADPAWRGPEAISCGSCAGIGPDDAPELGLALSRTSSLGAMLRWMARSPARPDAAMLLGVALPRRLTRMLADCAARLGNRPVLLLEDGEAVRAGQWRVLPGRSIAVPVRRSDGWVWRLSPARENGESGWIARQIEQFGSSAPGEACLYLFSDRDERTRAALARLRSGIADRKRAGVALAA